MIVLKHLEASAFVLNRVSQRKEPIGHGLTHTHTHTQRERERERERERDQQETMGKEKQSDLRRPK
jgi:hypothetical protein